MYDLYCDVTAVSLQTFDGNVFKMTAPSRVVMCKSSTILELVFFDFKIYVMQIMNLNLSNTVESVAQTGLGL